MDFHAGQLAQRDLRAGRSVDQRGAQHVEVVPQFARVAHVDRIALEPLDGPRNVRSANRRLHDIQNVACRQSVAGGALAIDLEIEVAATHHALGVGGTGARQRSDD